MTRTQRPDAPAVVPPANGDQRYRAVLAYDGGAFRGFSANEGVRTVAGELQAALSKIAGRSIEVVCAGRTDAGVHGWGQVISFDARPGLDVDRMQRSLHQLLGPQISVRDITRAADDFDARFSAKSRTYRYRILNQLAPDPFMHRTTWHVRDELDIEAMRAASSALVGSHDFASFCRARVVRVNGEEIDADLTRQVLSSEWVRKPDGVIEHWIAANAFCQQMVRSITGTLVRIGSGRLPADAMPAILAARDRDAASALAPPHGLTLWSVEY